MALREEPDEINSVIIAGGRADKETGLIYGLTPSEAYFEVIAAIWDANITITEIVSGGATGIDSLGEKYAKKNNIPVQLFPADWRKGKWAGMERNKQMAQYANFLIAVWDGKSPGTLNMIKEANKAGIMSHVRFV